MGYLKLNNAGYGYERYFHLSNISLSVSKGSFTGIIGPNGSGKSTLLKGIAGELQITADQIYLNNIDLNSMSEVERAKKIAVVSQFTSPIDITVEEYVLTGRIPYRKKYQFFESPEDFKITTRYMELTGIEKLRTKKFINLSGGEQQLASIAKALTQEPSLLLLDEPTSHLDISHQVQILNLIQELSHKLEITILMTIHDLNLASEYCDYLVLMKDGKMFQHGTPSEILNYKNIEEVYNTVVITQENPLSKKPSVFLVSNKMLTGNNKIAHK